MTLEPLLGNGLRPPDPEQAFQGPTCNDGNDCGGRSSALLPWMSSSNSTLSCCPHGTGEESEARKVTSIPKGEQLGDSLAVTNLSWSLGVGRGPRLIFLLLRSSHT